MGRVPLFLQCGITDCGETCLAMVAAALGQPIPNDFRVTGNGRHLTLRQLIELGRRCGLNGRGLKAELEDLDKLSLPAILHWDLDHFVVLTRVGRRWYHIHDPALGRRIQNRGELSRHFTGVVVEFTGTADGSKRIPRRRFELKSLPGYQWSHVRRLGWLALLCLGLQGLVIASPLFVQLVIDRGISSGSVRGVAVLILGFGLILGLRIIVDLMRGWWVVCYANLLSWDLDRGLFGGLLRRPLSWFQGRTTADVLSRYRSLTPVQQFLTHGVAGIAVDVTLMVLTMVFMLTYHSVVALVVLATAVSYGVVSFLLLPELKRRSLEQIAAEANEQSVVLETLAGMSTVRSWGLESVRERLWQGRRSETLSRIASRSRLILMVGGLRQGLFGMEYLIVIYLLAVGVIEARLSLGMFCAFLSFRDQFVSTSAGLVDRVIEFATLSMHLERLSSLHGTVIGSNVDELCPGPLILDRVWFRYGEFEPWLAKDLALVVEAGSCIVIRGDSGSGKSTLLRLLLSQLAPGKGTVRLGQKVLRGPGSSGFQQQSATLLDDDVLFTGSVADNVSLWHADARESAVEDSLRRADALEFVQRLPGGVRARLTEGGRLLSRGQQQRLLLARVFYAQVPWPGTLYFFG